MGINNVNILGAVLANVINLSAILVFIFRLLDKTETGHWIGIITIISIFPLIYLVITARQYNRHWIYSIWTGLMIAFIVVEFLFDWYPGIDFRDNIAIVIPYVMLFFGATGGMIGVASLAGKRWTWVTAVSFLVMFVLAFVQRNITGM